MPAPTVAVTVRLYGQDGAPYEGVTVTARLDKNDVYGGFIISADVTGVTDVDGTVIMELFPNDPTTGLGTTGSSYRFSASPPGSKLWAVTAQIPNAACNLEDVLS